MNKIVIILLFIIIILYLINNKTIGLKNNLLQYKIATSIVLNGTYDQQKLIKVFESYNLKFNQINTNQINFILSEYSSSPNIEIKINESKNKYIMNIIFDHKYYDMQCITTMINSYLKNDISYKEINIMKQLYFTDLLGLNLFYNTLTIKPKKYKFKQILVSKEQINNIKNLNTNYVSNIDVVISIITTEYLNYTNKNNANIMIIKSKNDNKIKHYIGNNITFHQSLINLDSLINMSLQIRKSYSNINYSLFINIDIYITSWYPIENYNNEILEINYINNNNNILMNVPFFIIISMINNNYQINIYY